MAANTSGTIAALNDTALGTFDANEYMSVSVQISGTWTGTLTFQVSNDGVNWVSKSLTSATGGYAASITANGVFSGDMGSRYFRVFANAWTSGAATLIAVWLKESQSTINGNAMNIGSLSPGSASGNLGKSEDAAHASGDVGVEMLGVRQPATPVAGTSAAGDYSYVLTDSEGKQVPTGIGAPEVAFQSYTNLTATTNVALRAAGAAGIRNYVKNIIADNTGASAARLIVQDGTTTIFSVTIPASSTAVVSFDQPIRGTAATALNGQLGAAGTVSVTLSGFLGV